ncbi:trans-1,2-dihydrobenzene-1,2-diol dehydrogenase [Drosophila nasuta]|uniref:trans-1,2-dihydrobenzene-1,2-diol dehydrogenase n=1 Tax=Drosophila nasuta TaxID=42062 RepID=UPI00295E3BD6|nr:trans-1,2-dihydrobenzene-1,2-diol dehydrogenase [Drosophila nasuta]XP_060666877.1 trans-1,2-dihydrobenzene-1,2-diol dehydrogenase [Drosophila nasuta]
MMRKLIQAVGRRVHQLGGRNSQSLGASKGRGNLLLQQRVGKLFEPLQPKTLRWGIAPVTLMAEDFVNALSVLPAREHRITACVDAYRSQSLEFGDRHRVPNVFTSFEQLAKCPDVDAVYISPSNGMHCELCHLMLNHDKHVLCEQPLAMTEQQVMGLMDKAQARGLFLMEGIWSRCTPAYRMLRDHLKRDQLGRVYHVDCSLGWPISKDLVDYTGYAGVTRDLAPYALQFALWVYRAVPQSIRVRGKLNRQGVDVANTIDVYFSDNRTARLTLSTQDTLSNEVQIFGERGNARLNNLWCPDLLVLQNVDYSFTLPQSKEPTTYHNRIGLCYEAQEVRNCILAGRTQSCLFSHNESRLLSNLTNQVHDMLGEQWEKVLALRDQQKQQQQKVQQQKLTERKEQQHIEQKQEKQKQLLQQEMQQQQVQNN